MADLKWETRDVIAFFSWRVAKNETEIKTSPMAITSRFFELESIYRDILPFGFEYRLSRTGNWLSALKNIRLHLKFLFKTTLTT